MRKLLLILLCIPIIGIASFPIENETTGIINEVYNQTLNTKTT